MAFALAGLLAVTASASPSPSDQFLGDAQDPAVPFAPPAGHGAAGPDHLVLADNGKFIVQSKAGVVLSSQTLLGFWISALPAADSRFAFAPRVYFDPTTNRYIATALGVTSNFVVIRVSPPQYYGLVAVSETSDPTGPWRKYAFNLNTEPASPIRPIPGVNTTQTGFSRRWIALSLVATNAGVPDGCHLYAFEKADLLNNAVGAGTMTRFGKVANNPVSPMVPNLDTAEENLYVLESRFGDGGIFYSLGVINDRAGTVYSGVNSRNIVTPYLHIASTFPFHPQAGTTDRILASKSEIQSLVFDGSSLWSVQTVYHTSPVRSALLWYRWNPANLSTLDTGVVEDATGANMYDYPSLSVNTDGDALIGFTRFNAGAFPTAGYAFRAATDPAGTFQKPVLYKSGVAAYHPLGAAGSPWGYFSTTSRDPADGRSLWTLQQYAETPTFNGDTFDDAWGLQWARVVPTLEAPTIGTPVALGVSSVQWNWADNAYNETAFHVRRASDNSAIVLNLPANTTFYRQAGLTPNAPQRAYVQATNALSSTQSLPSSLIHTFAGAPSGTAVTFRSSTTVNLAWFANGNPAGTQYRLQGATSLAALSLAPVSTTTSTNMGFTGLTPDTTWFFRVRARNNDGVDTAFDATVSTRTHPAAPAAPGAPDVTARSTGTLSWAWADLSSNESGFRLRRSSDSASISGDLAANTTSYIQGGLGPNTPQRLYAESFNVSGASASTASPTRYTAAAVPVAGTVTLSGLTAQFVWLSNGNPAGTTYQVAFAAAGFDPSFFLTSATTRSFPSLTPNTTYEFQVTARNEEGLFSAPSALLTRWVPPLPPAAPSAPTAVAFATHAVSWAWSDNAANEDGYRVRRDSDSVNLSGDLAADTTFFVQTGLGPNAPARVRAEAFNLAATSASAPSATAYSLARPPVSLAFAGVFQTSASFAWSGNGNPAGTLFRIERAPDGAAYGEIGATTGTAFTATGLTPDTSSFFRLRAENSAGALTAYSNVVSTRTVPGAPAAPASVFVIDETTGSIFWGWTDSAVNEAGYRVRRSSDNVSLSGDLPAGATAFLQAGLSPNSAQTIFVEAFNAGGAAGSASLSHFTDAALPAALAATPTVNSILLGWGANGNPPGTSYRSQLSPDGEVYGSTADSTGTSRLFTGLAENTTYFLRVRAANGDGNATGYVLLAVRTRLGAPSAPSAPVVVARTTGSLRWAWADNATNESGYRVFSWFDTGDGIVETDLSGNLAANTTGFLDAEPRPFANLPRRVYARADNAAGGADSPVSAEFHTLANPPTASTASVHVSSLTLTWDDNGNAPGTVFRAERADGAGPFAEFYVGASLETAVTGLSTGTYRFRVRAENGDGLLTAYDATVTADIAVPNAFDVCAGPMAFGPATVLVPAGAAPCGTIVTLVTVDTFPSGTTPVGGFRPVGVGIDIDADPGACGLTVTLAYADADIAGLNEARLVIARYDAGRGLWIPLASSVDAANNRVTTDRACAETVQILAPVATETIDDTAAAYPLPARTSMTFTSLPAGARIDIFTVSAERVRSLEADVSGQAVWDLLNESGQPVASGTYLARVEKDGADKVIKLVVQR